MNNNTELVSEARRVFDCKVEVREHAMYMVESSDTKRHVASVVDTRG